MFTFFTIVLFMLWLFQEVQRRWQNYMAIQLDKRGDAEMSLHCRCWWKRKAFVRIAKSGGIDHCYRWMSFTMCVKSCLAIHNPHSYKSCLIE